MPPPTSPANSPCQQILFAPWHNPRHNPKHKATDRNFERPPPKRCFRVSASAAATAEPPPAACEPAASVALALITGATVLNGTTVVDSTTVVLITWWIGGLAILLADERKLVPQLVLLIATAYAFEFSMALIDTLPFYWLTAKLSRFLEIDPAKELSKEELEAGS